MNVRKSDDFVADVEREFDRYVVESGPDLADQYLAAVDEICSLLSQHPEIGPLGRYRHPRLSKVRFFVLSKPFNKHLLFYEIDGDAVVMRRAMHGQRNLRKRLLEPPSIR